MGNDVHVAFIREKLKVGKPIRAIEVQMLLDALEECQARSTVASVLQDADAVVPARGTRNPETAKRVRYYEGWRDAVNFIRGGLG